MNKAAAIAVGVGVAVLVGAAYVMLQGHGDVDKTLTLTTVSGNCTISETQKDVRVSKGHKVTWKVENKCGSDQLLLVGNFRATTDPGNAPDCKAGIIESTWPFNPLDQANRDVYVPVGETHPITLKDAKNSSANTVTFYFDICMGGKKVDPRLDIDP